MSVQEAAVSLLQRVLFYVGIDWAAETHAVCVLDATGRLCWIDGVPYDPNKHGSAGKLRETATAA